MPLPSSSPDLTLPRWVLHLSIPTPARENLPMTNLDPLDWVEAWWSCHFLLHPWPSLYASVICGGSHMNLLAKDKFGWTSWKIACEAIPKSLSNEAIIVYSLAKAAVAAWEINRTVSQQMEHYTMWVWTIVCEREASNSPWESNTSKILFVLSGAYFLSSNGETTRVTNLFYCMCAPQFDTHAAMMPWLIQSIFTLLMPQEPTLESDFKVWHYTIRMPQCGIVWFQVPTFVFSVFTASLEWLWKVRDASSYDYMTLSPLSSDWNGAADGKNVISSCIV